jgi:peptidoglycan/LPS O-acetylase OafA/YrhL
MKRNSVAQRFFGSATLRFFGRYSYGAYVFHYSISEYFAHKRPEVLAMTHSKLLSVLLPAAVAFVLTMGLAWLSFHFFEKRFLALKNRFHAERPRTTLRNALGRS